MELFKKMFTVLLVLSFLFIQFPNPALAEFYTKANAPTKITKNAPQILSTPEENIPVVEEAAKRYTWKHVLIGLLAVAGIAALMGGGGGGGSSTPPPEDTGDLSVTW